MRRWEMDLLNAINDTKVCRMETTRKLRGTGFPSLAILWVQDRFLASAKFRRLTVRDQLAQANWGVRGVVKRDKMAEGKYKLLCSRFVFARPEDVNGSRWLDLYRFSVLPRHSL